MGVVTDIRTFASALIERSALAKQLGYTFSGKRRIYEVLGYDETITARQYRERYARGGIAGRVVDALAKATWRGEGIIFEDEDPKKETTFEAAWKALNDQLKVWSTLQRAHIQASLGSFSVLLLGAPGDFTTELPRGKPGGLLYMTPFGGGVIDLTQMRGQSSGVGADVQVSTWEEDSANPRFGQPLSYQLRRTNLTSPELQRPVHWTRVVHIPAPGFLDDAIFGPPGLEGVWNYLDDLDKVVGGGAEAFWMRANAGQQWDIDKKTTIPTDPKDKQAELDRLKDQAEAYEHQMSRIIRTRGVNINQLGSDVADFKNPSDALLTLIAGTTGIPKRILTGSEMGELASSQDRDNWNDQVKDCRTAYAHPVILRPFIERLIEYGYLPPSTQWEVEWPDIESMSEDEKLDTAKKAQSLNAAGEIVITGAELRETYLEKDPLGEEDLIVEPWRADLALKMAETNKSQGAVVFTDDEIRKTCYGWEPLKPEEKVPLTAPERVSATAPTPSVDAQGHPIQAKPQALPRPGLPRSGPIPALRAAELGQALEALEAAIEAEDLEAVGQIVGLAWDEDLHPRDDHGRFGPGSGWTAENGHVPNAEARVGQIVAKSKYGEIKVSKSLGGDIKYVAYRKNGEGVGSFKTVNSAKEALRKPTNTESFPSGYMSPDVAWKHLGDKPGHEFHGNQWKSGVSSSHIEKLETGGSFKQTFANESKVVNALHDVNDALKKAGWINNDWTPGEGGSDTGHGASYQYEKKGMTAIVTRHHLSLHLGSHTTDD